MLQKARKELPESVLKVERFEIPKVMGHIEGNKTVISNFHQIAGALRRQPEHLLKFILKELATPGEIKKQLLVLGRKLSSAAINEKIQKYANEFVICPECKKPDTQLSKEDKITFIKCQACGAKHTVRSSV